MNAVSPAPAPAALDASRWHAVFARLLLTEGTRFVNNSNDHGGPTRYGLSLRYLAQLGRINPAIAAELDINHDGEIDLPDIAGMSVGAANDVYFQCLWRPIAAQLPPPIDAAVFDQVVNDGVVPAVLMLQRACNSIPMPLAAIDADGVFGAETLQRVLAVAGRMGVSALLAAYRGQAMDRYRTIVARDPSQKPFLAGWLNRAAELGNV
jgi:lysozyme family protein